MDFIWRLGYVVIIGTVLWVLHSRVGSYPPPLPCSPQPRREVGEVLVLWGIALAASVLKLALVSPWLDRAVTDRTLRQVIEAPLLSVIYLMFPLMLVLNRNGWTIRDLGLSWRSQSADVSIFALEFGAVSGGVAFLTGQTVVGLEGHALGELILLLYNNAFLEEFYFRGVMQAKLERALGQRLALLWGGILYGSTHLFLDFSVLLPRGLALVLVAWLLQIMAGWLLGMVFMKTRSICPGAACHYLVNWLPSILAI